MSRIIDRGDLRSYRTEIPNMVDDMDLSLPAFRLYIHLKRVAGDSGASWEGVRRLAASCRMSIGSVRNAKVELEAKGLISIEPGEGEHADTITINDIWLENMTRYSDAHKRNVLRNEAEDLLEIDFMESQPARQMTHPRASGDTPPRARRHNPARLVTHPRASGDTQERTNEERTNEEERESARAITVAPTLPATPPPSQPEAAMVISCSKLMPKGMRLPNGFVPAGGGQNAVQIYYERFPFANPNARLTPPQETDLVEHCTDLQRLREVVIAYSRTNYRPANVGLILDWYDAGVPDRHETRGASSGTQRSDAARNGQASRPSWANYVAEPYDPAIEAEFYSKRDLPPL
jgi:hypothetical protein